MDTNDHTEHDIDRAGTGTPGDADEHPGALTWTKDDPVRPSWWLVAALVAAALVILWVAVATPGAEGPATSPSGDGTASPSALDEQVPVGSDGARPATELPSSGPVALSEACADAVGPIRELALSTPSALTLTEEQAASLSGALGVAQQVCTSAEYRSFTSDELDAWLLAPTG